MFAESVAISDQFVMPGIGGLLMMQVLEKLRELFFGYSEFPPVAFILCGNFLSCPTSSRNMKAYHGNFPFEIDIHNSLSFQFL